MAFSGEVTPEMEQHLGTHNGLASDSLDDAETGEMDTPVHPVPAMQGAFEESILEATNEHEIPQAPVDADAASRRHRLLESSTFDDSWISRWNQRSTAQHHPLVKLMAQIVFGMHLLQQQQAKSDKEVVNILQTHVNEVDTFLERTAEDFDVAMKDVEDRIRHLRLPMTHLDVFETMLDDKKFRTQLLTGNEKIEKIIDRTTRAMNASLLDVEKGVQANRELHRYMKGIQDRWPQDQRAISDVFGAMRGNEQGWKRYLRDLQHKGTILGRLLASLQKLIGEMSRMAAAASRRNKTQSSTVTPEPKSIQSPIGPRSKFSQEPGPVTPVTTSPRSSPRRTSNLNKPLPVEPQPVAVVGSQESTPKPHPVPFADRYEKPRQSPPEPITPPRMSADPHMVRQRPKTAGASGKEARAADARIKPSELLNFFQRPDPLGSNPNPLRSNPPDELDLIQSKTSGEHKLGRSHSHSTNIIMGTVSLNNGGAKVTRSRSQGALDVLNVPSVTNMGVSRPSQQDGRDSAMSMNSSKDHNEWSSVSADHTERRAAMRNTGFARRLSKRLKHLPISVDNSAPVENAAPIIKAPTPTDSAYASLKDKDSPPNETQLSSANRPESVIGPLPFENHASAHYSRPSDSSGTGVAASVKSLASSRSRTLSIRNVFRNKWKRSKAMAN